MFSGTASGPFGLFDIVLPLFHDVLRCLGHTFVRMRSQFPDGETSLAFLRSNTTRLAGGGIGATEVDGSP